MILDWIRRDKVSDAFPREISEALSYLTPETKSLLASLHGASPAICESVIQLIPFGSRASLSDLKITELGPVPEVTRITPLGFAVIAAAAAEVASARAHLDHAFRQ